MNVSSLFFVLDTRHLDFANALIGGFEGPLHNGPFFGTIFPMYSISLDDPYIYDLLKAYIHPLGFKMDTGSRIIQLKSLVVIRFRNDSLPPLTPKVHESSRLLSMVETDKSKNSTPITFDWTGISYPKQWEVRFRELRDFEKTKNQQLSIPKPLVFDRCSNSFKLPEGFPSPQFAPPLVRSSSMNNNSKKSTLFEPCSSSRLSFSGVHNNEHKGQHAYCPTYRKALERLKIKSKGVILYMLSLPRSHLGFTSTNPQGDTSFHLGINLPDTPFLQFCHDGLSKR